MVISMVAICGVYGEVAPDSDKLDKFTKDGIYKYADIVNSITSKLVNVTGVSISSGYIFVDGEYIEPPYTVSSSNGIEYVNDVATRKWVVWPPRDWTVAEKPQLPPYITKDSDLDDLSNQQDRLNGYRPRLSRYFKMRYSEEEAIEKYIAEYRKIPYVASLEREKGNSKNATMTTTKGITYLITFGSIGGKAPYYFSPPPSKKTVEAQIEYHRKKHESVLEKGGVLFILTAKNKNIIPLAGKLVAAELPVILHITTSTMTTEEKITELMQLKLLNAYSTGLWRRFVDGWNISQELTKRIEKYGDPATLHARRKQKIKDEIEQKRIRKAEQVIKQEEYKQLWKELHPKNKRR